MDNTPTTRFEMRLVPDRINVWLCFGRTILEQPLGPMSWEVYFAPRSIFGVVKWTANRWGTVTQQLSVLRAFDSTIGIKEAGLSQAQHPLLQVAGEKKVNQVLALIEAIHDQGIDAADVCPDYWRVLHWRLAACRQPHLYTRVEHLVYLNQLGHKR